MVAIRLTTDADRLAGKLSRISTVAVPKSVSIAMQRTTQSARDKARMSAMRSLDRPRNATIKAIRNRWPNRTQVRLGNAEGAVFVAPFLADELAPNVYGGREDGVPHSRDSVLEPTRRTRLNAQGNIPGLRRGSVTRRRRNRTRFLNVPINNKSKRLRHLSPGLYQIRNTRRSRTLTKLYTYQRDRRITNPKWREYPRVVITEYRKTFNAQLIKQLRRERDK